MGELLDWRVGIQVDFFQDEEVVGVVFFAVFEWVVAGDFTFVVVAEGLLGAVSEDG